MMVSRSADLSSGQTKKLRILSMDKDSHLDRLNILKRRLCVKVILAQDLVVVWGLFQREFGRGMGDSHNFIS